MHDVGAALAANPATTKCALGTDDSSLCPVGLQCFKGLLLGGPFFSPKSVEGALQRGFHFLLQFHLPTGERACVRRFDDGMAIWGIPTFSVGIEVSGAWRWYTTASPASL